LVKFRYISWQNYGKLLSDLTRKISSSGPHYDLVVGIARGGIPVAMFVADSLGVKLDIINVKSYSGIAQRDKPKIVSTLTESVESKSILLVDDLVDQGDTMESIVDYLHREKANHMSTAVIFKKPWSKFEPDFYLEVVDAWIVFPYERGEVKRARGQQRQQLVRTS
jgi:hypoxanthine phosphoribosyltransferase